MGRCAEQAAAHRRALLALREELQKLGEALAPADEVLAGTAAGFGPVRSAIEALAWKAGSSQAAVAEQLRGVASSLGALRSPGEQLRSALAAAARSCSQAGGPCGGAKAAAEGRAARARELRPKAKQPRAQLDFSAFTRARWEAERLKCVSMMGSVSEAAESSEAGASGIRVYMQDMPKPFQPEKPCTQVKGRHIMVNSAEKARKIYTEVSVSGTLDRTGFIRGANLARFSSLATERSDCPTAKKGGDLGWISKGKLDAKLEEVAMATPRCTCSPPFKIGNSFHLFFCEERKG